MRPKTWIDSVAPAAPTRIGGRYELLALIGQGGMGTVYRAHDVELDEIVALKMVRSDRAHDPAMLARLREEVRVGRRVTHANVVRTYDLGEQDGMRFLTMELLDGGSLADRLDDVGRVTDAEARSVGIALCRGLQAAHAAGVVHRDLKPANVLLGPLDLSGAPTRVAIADFGVASRGSALGIVGTRGYMAPEQVAGQIAGPRADLYALGCVLYEMLTGLEPTDDPPTFDDQVHPALAAVVEHCLQRDPEQRPPSAAALLDALEGVVVPVEPPARLGPTRRSVRVATVAVLPILADEADRSFGRSLANELVALLERARGVLVCASEGVPLHREPAEIGRELDVDAVVVGRLERDAGQLRLRLELIGTSLGLRLVDLSTTLDGARTLAVLQGFASHAAAALDGELPSMEAVPIRADVVETLLVAREQLRLVWTWGDLDRARQAIDRVVALAPDEPMVLTTLALLRAREAFRGGAEGGSEGRRAAEEAAERALACAPMAGEAWLARGLVHLYSERPASGAQALARSVSLAPGSAQAVGLLGGLFNEVGDAEAARHHLDAALALNPSRLDPRAERVRLAALEQDWDTVERLASPVTEEPYLQVGAKLLRFRFAMWAGLPFDEPIDPDLLARVVPRIPAVALLYETLAAATRGAVGEGMLQLERDGSMVPSPRLRAVWSQVGAECALFVGRLDVGQLYLRASVEAGLFDIAWVDRCPLLAPARAEPWFADLRQTVACRAAEVHRALVGAPVG